MPVHIAFEKLTHLLDISGFAFFVGSFALKGAEDMLHIPVPDIIQTVASIGAVLYVAVKIIGVHRDNESKRIKNEKDQLELTKLKKDHDKEASAPVE